MALLLVAGAAGATLFVLCFTVDGLTRPGYRPRYHPVSALALGERGWLQTTNFVLAGSLIALGGVGLWGTAPVLAVGTIALGLGLIASGIFPMDPMREYPPGTAKGDPTEFSAAHRGHDNAGTLVFLLFPLLPVIAAVSSALPGMLRIASVPVALVVALAAGRFSLAWERDLPNTGAWQRLAIAASLLWLAVTLVVVAIDAAG